MMVSGFTDTGIRNDQLVTNEKKRKKVIKLLTWPLVVLTFIGGIISYIHAGCAVDDAIYEAINLFKFSYDADHVNVGIRVLRWIAPLSVATTLFVEIAPLFAWARDRLVFWFMSDRTIIYSDCDAGQALYESMDRKAVLRKTCDVFALSDNAARSVIIMKDDENALKLYKRLEGMDHRHLCLNSMEPNLIPSSGNTVICNINDIIAGYFWHKQFMDLRKASAPVNNKKHDKEELSAWRERDGIHIFKNNRDRKIEMIIWGYDDLGKRLLYKGLLFNLFSPDQKIIYHVYDPDCTHLAYKEDIDGATRLNGDEVVFYNDHRTLRDMVDRVDAVIMPEETVSGRIQELVYSTTKPEIYYYDPNGIKLETVFGNVEESVFTRLHGFGADSDILKEKYILHSGLLDKAKDINKHYYDKHPDTQHPEYDTLDKDKLWEKLSGFRKGSNVNCADYAEIGLEVKSWNSFTEDELASLEHIRWCRYIYLNHMSDSDKKDLLVPYMKLPEEERIKDIEKVRQWEKE